MLVIDASIAVKWFIPEAGTKYAHQILEEYDHLVAPELIRIEVISAITKAVRTGRIEREKAEESCQDWQSVVDKGIITLIPDSLHLETATALSLDLTHAFQDCIYLAIAKKSTASLVTLDKKMLDKAKLCQVETIKPV